MPSLTQGGFVWVNLPEFAAHKSTVQVAVPQSVYVVRLSCFGANMRAALLTFITAPVTAK